MTKREARSLLNFARKSREYLNDIRFAEEKEQGSTTVVGSLGETISWLDTLIEELCESYKL